MPSVEADLIEGRSSQDLRELSQSSLYFFSRGILGRDFMTPEVHKPLCSFLQSIALDPKFTKRALVKLPRSFLKTTICSTDFPLWIASLEPDGDPSHWRGSGVRSLICQNTVTNAEARVHEIRGNVLSTMYSLLFPDLLPNTKGKGSKWADRSASLMRPKEWPEGTFNAAGIGSSAGTISAHYGIRILDDLCTPKKEEMTAEEIEPSPLDIEHAIGFYKSSHELALDPTRDIELVVGTPYTLYDLSSYITEQESWVTVFKIPAWLPSDCLPIGKNFNPLNPPTNDEVKDAWENQTGGPAYPSRFPRDILEQKLMQSGTYIFYTQFLLLPVDPTQTRFTKELIQTWSKLPDDLEAVIIADPATEKKTSADTGLVVVGWSNEEKRMYVLEPLMQRIGMLDTTTELIRLVKKWRDKGVKVLRIVIEDNGYQDALRENCEKEFRESGVNIWVDTITAVSRQRKDDRIKSLEPFLARGDLLLGPGQTQLSQQLIDFPYGIKKDLIDPLAYAPKIFGIGFLSSKPREQKREPIPDKYEVQVDELLDEVLGKRDKKKADAGYPYD